MERNANVFEFHGSKAIVSAKGPNMSKQFTSYRPNLLSSTMTMPRNFEKQSSAASLASQRSIYHGRDTSPTASICSDLQPRNFHQPFYQRGFSQRAVFNREGSPMSMRSIETTASMADFISDAIEKIECSNDEWGKIWHAVNRKHEFRKKAQKRRKMKMLKNLRNKSDDEGEQGSCSSISNDDCASTRTGYRQRYNPYCKENVPQSLKSFDCRSEDTYRSNRDVYRGYPKSDSQNPYQTGTNPYFPANSLPYQKPPQFGPTYFSQKNSYSQNGSVSQHKTGFKNSLFSQRYINGQANMSSIQRNNLNGSMCSTKSMQNMTMMTQRERFRDGFQFPSQKFNRSTALHKEQDQVSNKQLSNKHYTTKHKQIRRDNIDELSDENDDIFLDTTAKPKAVAKKTEKRKVESLGDIPKPTKKKPKMTTNNEKAERQTQKKDNNEKNEFEFLKPQFPVSKSAPAKPQEKMISKSLGAPDHTTNIQEMEKAPPQRTAPSPEPDIEPEQPENTQLTTSDMSMRPSFMKRKLFTQTLDVTEKKNNSFESGTDSPQSNIYSALTREKHKTRKLATSQSLLSRDVNQDDDNLLDLIHKIVPPNQVNSTISANISKPHSSRMSGTKHGNDGIDDKWDITSIISTCNNDSVSETYTDDEIFRNDGKKTKGQEKPILKKGRMNDKSNKSIKANDKPKPEIKKPDNIVNPTNNKNVKEGAKKNTFPAVPKVATPAKVCPATRVVPGRSRIDAFWDTDESDHEAAGVLQPFNLPDQTENHMASPKQNSTESHTSTILTKAKTLQRKVISPSVVLHDIKKQPSKKVVNKTNKPKTSKKMNDISKANNLDKNKIDTPTVPPRTRRQLSLSTTLETVNNSQINEKYTSVNDTAPNKTKNQKKQNNEKKATKVKILKTPPFSELKDNLNKKQQVNISKKQGDTPKNQRTVKKDVKSTKLRAPTEHLQIDMCKVLRSRMVDLSSSFNSDKFELTMSRTRKSRTPSKRISFNKSKNILVNSNKIRNRATKS